MKIKFTLLMVMTFCLPWTHAVMAQDVDFVPYMYVTLSDGSELDSIRMGNDASYRGLVVVNSSKVVKVSGREYRLDAIEGVRFRFHEEEVSNGISEIPVGEVPADDRVLSLGGQLEGYGSQCLEKLGKGIYIYQGKKYIKK